MWGYIKFLWSYFLYYPLQYYPFPPNFPKQKKRKPKRQTAPQNLRFLIKNYQILLFHNLPNNTFYAYVKFQEICSRIDITQIYRAFVGLGNV
jgi:hypothetical protein